MLAEAGVTCIDDIRRGPVLDGVAPEHLMQIVQASQGTAPESQSQLATQPWPPRPDAPVRRPAGLEAEPANRKKSPRQLGRGRAGQIVAPAGLRTWRRYAAAWEVDPWPVTWETLRCIGASLGGQLPVCPELFRRRLPAPGGPLAAGCRPLVTTTGPAGGQVNRQRAAGHSAERSVRARLPRPPGGLGGGLAVLGRRGCPRDRRRHHRRLVYAQGDRTGA